MSDLNNAFHSWLNERAATISADPDNPIAKETALRAAFTNALTNAFTETTDEESK